MDQNDPAWKIAAAAHAAVHDGKGDDAFDKLLGDLKPSSKTLARAYALCVTEQTFWLAGQYKPALTMMINARLQVTLLQEHIAAQERMSRTINILTGVLVVLTVVLVIFGVVEIAQRPDVCY